MICMNCFDYEKVLEAEKGLVTLNVNKKFDELVSSYMKLNNFYEECENCSCQLEESEPIIDDEGRFFDELLELLGKSMSPLILNCEQCSEQDHVISKINYVFNGRDEGDVEVRERLERSIPSGSSVSDFIQEMFGQVFSESDMGEIAKNLVCQECRHGAGESYEDKMNFGYFDLYETMYTQYDNESFFRRFYGDDIPELLTLLAETFSIEQLNDLKGNYEKSIHYTDPNFQKLIQLVTKIRKEMVEVKPAILSANRYVYHARSHGIKEKPYSYSEIWAAPYGFSGNGRYNTVGSETFYASNSYTILPKELRKQAEEQLTVGVFKIQEDKVLLPVDILFSGYDYYKLISEIPNHNNNNITVKKEYSITNLIYIAAINSNFDGIVYKSVQDDKYLNYLLFDVEENEDLELVAKFEY